jgi:hypothetical protein
MKTNLNHYMIKIPGTVYAGDFYGKTKRDAINAYKKWANICRMPRGFAIWRVR